MDLGVDVGATAGDGGPGLAEAADASPNMVSKIAARNRLWLLPSHFSPIITGPPNCSSASVYSTKPVRHRLRPHCPEDGWAACAPEDVFGAAALLSGLGDVALFSAAEGGAAAETEFASPNCRVVD